MFYVMFTLLFIPFCLICKGTSHSASLSSSSPLIIHLPILLIFPPLINTIQKHAICTSRRSCHSVVINLTAGGPTLLHLLVSADHLNIKFIICLNPVPPKVFVNSSGSGICKVLNALNNAVVKVSCAFLFFFPFPFFHLAGCDY